MIGFGDRDDAPPPPHLKSPMYERMPDKVVLELEALVARIANICRGYGRYQMAWQVDFGEPPNEAAESWYVRAMHIRCTPRALPDLATPQPSSAAAPAPSPPDRR